MSWLVLAGCVARPPRSLPTEPLADRPLAGPPCLSLRIGVEHLPPELGAEERVPHVESPALQGQGGSAPRRPGTAPQDPVRLEGGAQALAASAMQREERARADDPVVRETRLFMADLLAADSRRVRRQAALPIFDYALTTDPLFLLPAEREVLQAQRQWASEHALQLFQRPLEQLARRLPLVRQIEIGRAHV
mgnify:CR=1 FL=1